MENVGKHREDKQQLRKMMETKRQLLSEEQRQSASEVICRLALDIISAHVRSSEHQLTILTYIPFRNEVDITPLIRSCWKAGYLVTVPKVDKALRSMEAYEISCFEELEPGAWGIPEPRMTVSRVIKLSEIDIIIVPGLAYDRKGARIGYGSGFYDRFLDRYIVTGLPHPFKLAVCFDIQLRDDLPMEQHDLRVDTLITEQTVYDFRH